ncbi:MAG TPA: hypothetical protein DIC35_01055 [Candidatus Moranbacteria bacterium]|nr:hypothetical protein [Candidatus Moranbacteria bacterium]
MRKKIFKFSIKFSVSLAFLTWIIFKVDWREVASLLSGIKSAYIALYFLFLACGILISSYKWKLLAQFKGIRLSLSQFFRLYLTGTFINNFMPSFVGGDAYRIYQVGKEEKKFSESASAVVMDRLTGLLGAMILAVIFSAANFSVILGQKILLLLNAIILLSIFGGVIFYATRRMSFWKKTIGIFGLDRILPWKFSKFFGEVAHYAGKKRILRQTMAWSIVFGIVGLSATNYVIFLSLGEKLPMLNYLSVIFLISFVSSIPISINNIGVKEWAYVTFFGFFGVPSAVAITAAILGRVLQMLFSFLALPIYLKNKK